MVRVDCSEHQHFAEFAAKEKVLRQELNRRSTVRRDTAMVRAVVNSSYPAKPLMAFIPKDFTIEQLRAVVQRGRVSAQMLSALRRDERQGVRVLLAQVERQRAAERRERRRIDRMLSRERALWRRGVRYVAGVDEVGVGPLAGPVVAAAVIFDVGDSLAGVDDSKRLDPDARKDLAAAIRERAAGVGIGCATVEEIDRINIYRAGVLAMRRAVEALPLAPQHLLVDARIIPDLPVPQRPIIRGDATCFSIAAASILAKTYRDELMVNLDRRYPQYGFRRHKGYATAEHQAAIRRYGPCELHRRSYTFLRELRGQYSPHFYELKERLTGLPAAAELRAIERELETHGAGLNGAERKKLRLLIARRTALL